jgi:CAAX prenyl protease-like protein
MFGVRRSAFVRVAPFAVFMLFLALRGIAPSDGSWGFDSRWLYGVQTLVVAAMLAVWWRDYGELSRLNAPDLREAGLAVAVGLAVCALWVVLDAPWMTLDMAATEPFKPLLQDGSLDWPLVLTRLAGAALLVPVMEELFWRSFLMRWLQAPLFDGLPPGRVGLKAVLLSTFVFVLAHTLWLAAALAGLAYAWLYVRSGKLWVPVIAHAVTNFVLGTWVVMTGNWQFW